MATPVSRRPRGGEGPRFARVALVPVARAGFLSRVVFVMWHRPQRSVVPQAHPGAGRDPVPNRRRVHAARCS